MSNEDNRKDIIGINRSFDDYENNNCTMQQLVDALKDYNSELVKEEATKRGFSYNLSVNEIAEHDKNVAIKNISHSFSMFEAKILTMKELIDYSRRYDPKLVEAESARRGITLDPNHEHREETLEEWAEYQIFKSVMYRGLTRQAAIDELIQTNKNTLAYLEQLRKPTVEKRSYDAPVSEKSIADTRQELFDLQSRINTEDLNLQDFREIQKRIAELQKILINEMEKRLEEQDKYDEPTTEAIMTTQQELAILQTRYDTENLSSRESREIGNRINELQKKLAEEKQV